MNQLFFTHYKFNQWRFVLVGTRKGICYIKEESESDADLDRFKLKYFPCFQWIERDHCFVEAKHALSAYLSKKSIIIDFEIDEYGTDFQRLVWQQLRQLPYGQTTSYQAVAQQIGRPKAVRAVAQAIGKNPLILFTPCHRVIGKNGGLTGYRAGLNLKKKFIKLEHK